MIFYSIMLLFVYCFSALSLGAGLLRFFGGGANLRDRGKYLARPVGAFLLGAGLLANVWLILSLLPGGWFRPALLTGVLAGCLLIGFRLAWREFSGICVHFGRAVVGLVRREHWTWKIIGLATLGAVVVYWLTSTLPPKGDAAAFYMTLPKIMSCTHKLEPMTCGYADFTQIGLHGEMHFAALMSLGSDQAATMMVFVIAIASAVMLLALADKAGLGGLGKWILLAMVFTSSAVTRIIPGGKVDLFGSAMGLAAVFWAMEITEGQRAKINWGSVVLAGVFSGFAVVAKISLLGSVVPMVGLLAVWRVWLAGRDGKCGMSKIILRILGCCAILIFSAGIATIPHLVKNGVLFGQPLAPFYPGNGGWLRQELLSPAAADHLLRIYPLAIYLGLFPGMYGAMSALGLAFWPLALLLKRPRMSQFLRSDLTQLTAVAVLAVAVWALMQTTVFSLRYFLPPLLLLLLLPAKSAEYCWRSGSNYAGKMLRVGIVICMLTALSATLSRPKGHPGKALGFICGKYSLAEVGDTAARQGAVVNSLSDKDQRVYVATYYSYFLRPDLLARANSQAEDDALRALPTNEQRWSYLYDHGFRFIMVGKERSRPVGDGKNCRISCGFELDTEKLPAEFRLEPVFTEFGKAGPAGPFDVVYRLDKKS